MVSSEALKKLQEQVAAWPITQRFVVHQLIEDYSDIRKDLLAYKDTGLTPELVQETAELAIWVHDNGIEKIKEWIKADKDGRLMVLPCKVGQRVFALLDTDKHISECEVKQICMGNKISFIGLEPIGARGREYGVALNGFGKTVFFTREEAEKELETMKDD